MVAADAVPYDGVPIRDGRVLGTLGGDDIAGIDGADPRGGGIDPVVDG
jgi:hypothetical protein